MRPDDLAHILALVLTPVLTAPIAAPSIPSWGDALACRPETVAPAIAWIRPSDSENLARLDSWCVAVGTPSLHAPSGANVPVSGDSLAVVVWNTNVDAADVRRFLRDLRAGDLHGGGPVEHFVLLLQEVHRGGSAVPAILSADARSADRIGGRGEAGERLDIVDLAREEGLHLFYVPSMRNGTPDDGGAPEDRGNAVLATLPLVDLTAIELPVERQRRVAVSATVEVTSADGVSHGIRFVSAHLENRAPWTRAHRTFGAAQTNQARALVASLERLSHVPATVVGGDFNTWLRGGESGSLEALRIRYPSAVHPEGATRDLPLFLPGLRLDHLFLRVPRGWEGRYEVIADSYGSDHLPLLGWIRMSP